MATNAFDAAAPFADQAEGEVFELGAAPIRVAQTDTPVTPPTAEAPARTVIEVGQGSVLTLPAGATIDAPRVNGTDLEFVQPDGTVIVVPNGAITGLTIVIDGTTIPAETVAAIFDASGIQTAAGPETPTAIPSSGGNFATPVPGIGDGLPLIDLLGNTDFGFGPPETEDLVDGGTRRAAEAPVNSSPELNLLPGEEKENGVVREAGLPFGSVGDIGLATTFGQFQVSDPDGIADLESITITSGGGSLTVPLSALNNATFPGANGLLTILSYDPATGIASYSYTLSTPTTDTPGAPETDTFSLSVSDGAASSTPVDLVVTIFDDVPNAIDDTNSVAEDAAAAITGNVLTNDLHTNGQPGADTPTSFVSWQNTAATYGTFTDTGNGTYSYELSALNATVQGLGVGDPPLTETFVYMMQDADGSQSQATLTITITGTNDAPVISAVDVDGAVTEKAEPTEGGTLTDTGSMTFNDVDLTDDHTVSISAPVVTGASATALGSLSITPTSTTNVGPAGTTLNWTFTVADAALDFLAAGETVTQVYTVTVGDGQGGTDTQDVTITITGTNDAPVISVDGLGAVVEDATSPNLTDTGTLSFTDVDLTDTHTVTAALSTAPTWSGGTLSNILTASQIAALTSGFTLGANAWTYSVPNSLVQFLDTNETIAFSYVVTVTDSSGQPNNFDTEIVTITITGTNDAPVAASTCVWVPSDPAQQLSGYSNGYPLLVSVPTDIDGENLVVTATNAPTGVYYFNGSTYVAVTTGTTLYNSGTGVNFLDDLVYRPTLGVSDVPVTTLNLNASDSTANTAYSVTMTEVAPNRLPATSTEISGGNQSLNSGRDFSSTLVLTQTFLDGISSNLAAATIRVLTDFQESPFDVPIQSSEQSPTTFNATNAGSQREGELQVELWIGSNKFAIVEDDLSAADFEQSWFFDAASGLMIATVSYANIRLLDALGVTTSTTLAGYLLANPPVAGQTWTLNYRDNDGGNYQGRLARFEFFYNDPGDPGVLVVGDNSKDNLIYGTSGNDNLNGGALNDTIIGREGNDVIVGGNGNDTLRGGLGNDTIDGGAGLDIIDFSEATSGINFTLVQSSSNTTVNLSALGLGTDAYRNVEGVAGSSHNDTFVGTSLADTLLGAGGNDTLTGGTGVDRFVFAESGTSNADTISDFVVGASGDILDLGGLLDAVFTTGNTVSNFVRVVDADTSNNGGSSILQVDTSGAGTSWVNVATLQNTPDGVDTSDHVRIFFEGVEHDVTVS
jgi:VCBS repeat-containing protein